MFDFFVSYFICGAVLHSENILMLPDSHHRAVLPTVSKADHTSIVVGFRRAIIRGGQDHHVAVSGTEFLAKAAHRLEVEKTHVAWENEYISPVTFALQNGNGRFEGVAGALLFGLLQERSARGRPDRLRYLRSLNADDDYLVVATQASL